MTYPLVIGAEWVNCPFYFEQDAHQRLSTHLFQD